MLTRIRRLLLLGTVLVCVARATAPGSGEFLLGANFNEHLTAARPAALDLALSPAGWVRGFLPAHEFLAGDRDLATDPGLATFHAAAAGGRHVALTLKWDFKRRDWRVPTPDSSLEQRCFAWAVEVARTGRPDLLLLVNETFIDTPDEDLRPDATGTIPFVRFLQRLAAHVAAADLTGPDGHPLPLGAGGFTRLHSRAMQEHPATRALLPWLASSPDLHYVNFHLHHESLADFDAALTFAREALADRPFVITEFSLVWAFRDGLGQALGATPAGRAFCARFNREPNQLARDYLSAAATNPVSETELHAFLRSTTWFDPDFLARACQLMTARGVTLATYAYLQEASGLERAGSPLRPDTPPWRLNPVFQERHATVPDADRLAHQLGFYHTFRRYQAP